jgi:hypothetical protein
MYHVIVRGAVEGTKEAAVGEALHAIVALGIKKLSRDDKE